jgi:hypothetical protein
MTASGAFTKRGKYLSREEREEREEHKEHKEV